MTENEKLTPKQKKKLNRKKKLKNIHKTNQFSMYWSTPKIWENETVFIIGGGPSLKLEAGIEPDEADDKLIFSKVSELLTPIHDKCIIGVNDAFLLGSWVDVCYFGDCRWYQKWQDSIKKFSGLKVTSCDACKSEPGIRTLIRGQKGIDMQNKHIAWNTNSGASAVNLAMKFGATTIILIGFDMSIISDTTTNWHNRHNSFRGKVAKIKEKQTYDRFMNAFANMATIIKNNYSHIKVINANLDSNMVCFPKISLQEGLSLK